MATPRNFEQLLIVKQLYQDSALLVDKGDIFSLSKAIIFLDLSIELTLKAILLNLNPNFLAQLYQQPQIRNLQKQNVDVSWHTAWNQASEELKGRNKSALSEEAESRNLRNLRNGIQHNGQTPAIQDAKRYLASTNRMLVDAFRNAFDLDFEDFRNWDFIQNKDLKLLLTESEDFLAQGKLLQCLYGCILTHRLVVAVIQRKTNYGDLEFYYSFELNKIDTRIKTILKRFNEFLTDRFNKLEVEILLVGMGMLITDTQRFLSFQKFWSDFREMPTINMKKGFTDEDIIEAKFMLEYLFKLLRFIEASEPETLKNIIIKIPLSQKIRDS